MIHEIEVANFQSLRKLKVRVGKFTVITGPTGAGKSGFIRAVRTLAFNARGTSFITHGEKTCSVAMHGDEAELTGMDDDPWAVTITRGGRDSYRVNHVQTGKEESETFTKLAGKVPGLASQIMRLGEINFAGQYDRPYLLDSTGSEVARVLGKLTNVTLLYRAAQEANRRRLAVNGELKTRMADLDNLQDQARQYATLGAEHEAVVAAEVALARSQELAAKRTRLNKLIADRELAWRRLHAIRDIPEPPSLDNLIGLVNTMVRLRTRTAAMDDMALTRRARVSQEQQAVAAARAAQLELNDYMAQWDVCPACGQPVRTGSHPH